MNFISNRNVKKGFIEWLRTGTNEGLNKCMHELTVGESLLITFLWSVVCTDSLGCLAPEAWRIELQWPQLQAWLA